MNISYSIIEKSYNFWIHIECIPKYLKLRQHTLPQVLKSQEKIKDIWVTINVEIMGIY